MDPKFVNLPGFFECLVPAQPSRIHFRRPHSPVGLFQAGFAALRHLPLLPPHVDRLQEGTHPDPQRSLYSLSSSFRISGDFPEFPHHTLDLIRQICVMPASKSLQTGHIPDSGSVPPEPRTPASARGNCLRHPDGCGLNPHFQCPEQNLPSEPERRTRSKAPAGCG